MREYIVLARDGVASKSFRDIEATGAKIVETYTHLRAALVRAEDDTALKAYGTVVEDFDVHLEELEDQPDDPTNVPESGWNLDMLRVQDAHDAGYTRAGVKVAVVDTGCDFSHEVFNGMNVYGYNVLDDSDNVRDTHGHGTGTAGLVAQVAPDVEVYSIKVFGTNTSDTKFSTTLKGIDKAMDLDVDVINCSFGRYGRESSAEKEVYKRVHDAGITVACSSGNYGTDHIWHYPSAYDWNLSVGSVNSGEKRSSFSCYGETTGLDLMAPGEKVTLPKVGGGYRLGSGTSFASPHAAGAAALLKGKDASMTPDDIMGSLKGGARQPAEYNDHEYGAGIIDLYETLVGA